jgi:3-dehydroquinate synthase class II
MPRWLACQISRGMFSDERSVVVQTIHGNVSLFVPVDSVDDKEQRVRVRVLEEGTQAVAVMPDEHQSIVNVNSSELHPI